MGSKPELFDRMVEVMTKARGDLDPSRRSTIVTRASDRGASLPPDLETLVDKVAWHAYKVTDSEVEQLKGTYSEDAIFEVIVASAVGAARLRASRALAATRGDA